MSPSVQFPRLRLILRLALHMGNRAESICEVLTSDSEMNSDQNPSLLHLAFYLERERKHRTDKNYTLLIVVRQLGHMPLLYTQNNSPHNVV
jgi:hypothetical protein